MLGSDGGQAVMVLISSAIALLASSVGIAVWSSGDKLDTSQTHTYWKRVGFQREYVPMKLEVGVMTGLDSLQPVSGWWMYEVKG